eukprot:13770881-Ditylum_brightwellii.AAC.1
MVCGIVNKTVKQRRTQAINMRFHWVRDHCAQRHFLVYWALGTENKADYHTKHYTGAHHRRLRPEYLHGPRYLTQHVKIIGLMGLQGCVEFGSSPDPLNHDTRHTSSD